jgi:hypothetical protein
MGRHWEWRFARTGFGWRYGVQLEFDAGAALIVWFGVHVWRVGWVTDDMED